MRRLPGLPMTTNWAPLFADRHKPPDFVAIAIRLLTIAHVNLDAERLELRRHLFGTEMVMDVELFESSYRRTRQQRRRAIIGHRSQRKIEDSDPLDHRRRSHRSRDLVRDLAVPQSQIFQFRKQRAIEYRRQISDGRV